MSINENSLALHYGRIEILCKKLLESSGVLEKSESEGKQSKEVNTSKDHEQKAKYVRNKDRDLTDDEEDTIFTQDESNLSSAQWLKTEQKIAEEQQSLMREHVKLMSEHQERIQESAKMRFEFASKRYKK